jgi:hypothetical protein
MVYTNRDRSSINSTMYQKLQGITLEKGKAWQNKTKNKQ